MDLLNKYDYFLIILTIILIVVSVILKGWVRLIFVAGTLLTVIILGLRIWEKYVIEEREGKYKELNEKYKREGVFTPSRPGHPDLWKRGIGMRRNSFNGVYKKSFGL